MGHEKAQYNLSCLLETGRGVPRDTQNAAKWLFEAAEGGYANAQVSVGCTKYTKHEVLSVLSLLYSSTGRGSPASQGFNYYFFFRL